MGLVFDAEPVIAYGLDERGATVVAELFDQIASGDRSGAMSGVTFAEVHYIVTREATETAADEYVEFLRTVGIEPCGVTGLNRAVSRFKREYGVALGDSFALATAAQRDATLVAGADDDFDEIETRPDEPSVRRFRTMPE